MLYVAPLLKIGRASSRFGYVDDVALMENQSWLSANCEQLSISLKEALDWGQAEDITFDPAKSESQHFSGSRADKDPGQTPSVSHGNMSVSKNITRPYTKWLGIYLDKNLTFKWHV
ncbi:hypothetical protein K3495_g416 [Podosphaera aphanis]|nr:hypothetical protein K3495_g416 [Podosphaera aphanis]